MRPGKLVILSATVGAAFASAGARWTDFAPKPFENALYVEAFASHESDDNRGRATQFRWDDTFIREEVTLFSRGYFYHPRFVHYLISLSGTLKQENYDTTGTRLPGWMTGSGVEYEARLFFLPEHAYNVDVFALRHEPLYMTQSAVSHNSVETSNGAQFRYRAKPFFFHAGYLDNTTSSSFEDANVKRLVADGQYFRSYAGGSQLSLNALYNNSWFTGAGGLDGTSRDYGAGGFFDVTRARFNATVTKSTTSQDSPLSGRFDNDRFAFHELLTVYLPVHFRTEVSYRILDNTSTTPASAGSGREERTETIRELQLDLIHRLYQSLDSRYTFLHNSRTSTGGDSTLTAQTLNFNYGKTIPRGRAMAGINLSRSDSDNRGRLDIVNEAHPGTAVPGAFLLGQQNVEPGSVDVSLPSPVPPFPIVHLVENVDFTVTPIANSLQISINTLPPQFVIPGTYDLSVSFSLVSGQFELLTRSYAGNVSVALLDNLLTPYLGYVAVRSDVVSGDFPGVSLDSTTTTVGVNFLDGPWRAMGEYQSLHWAVSPYRAWRADVQYVGSVTPSTRVYATGSYLHRYYPAGTSSNLPEPYTDQAETATGNIQQDLFSRTLTLSAGGTYARQQGRVRGDAFSLNGSLTWKIGKLDLSAGASAYGSETQAFTAEPYTRLHQYYYFRIRRQFSR